jgi:Winged helix DNA-binding domain
MTAVSLDQVRGFRLARQHLDRRAPAGSLLEVVRALCGVHAQLASSAELALWARIEGLERDEVREALEERRSLVKTWAMRGTLHLVTPDDLGLIVAVLGPRWDNPGGAWLRGHGVPEEHFEAIVRLVPRAVGAKPKTREELADRLAEVGGPELRERLLSGWGALLKPSAHRGDLCFGPNRGRNVTFVRPDRWLRGFRAAEPEEAHRELTRRFLAGYGPAAADDFARWVGLRGAQPKRMLAALGDEAVEFEVDGGAAFALAADLDALRSAGRPEGVRLLPAFDPYVVGSRPRSQLVAQSHEAKIFRPQGWISPVVLVDGVAVGTWKHERGRVELELFGRITKTAQRAVDDEAERVRDFLG